MSFLEPLTVDAVALTVLALGVATVGWAALSYVKHRQLTSAARALLAGAAAMTLVTGVVWLAGRTAADISPEVDIAGGPVLTTAAASSGRVPTAEGTLPPLWADGSLGNVREASELLASACVNGVDDFINISTNGPASGLTGIGALDGLINIPGNLVTGIYTKPAACMADAKLKAQMSRGSEGWFNSSSVPHTTPGYPLDRYNMFYQAGLASVGENMMGWGTSLIWTVGKFGLKIAMWALDWAVSGRIVEVVGVIPEQIARLLNVSVVGAGSGFTLGHLALICLGIASAWGLLRGRYAEAVGGLLFGVIAMTVGFFVLLNYDGYYQGAKTVKEEFARAGMIGTLADHTGADGAVDATVAVAPLLDAVVHIPWENLNFGSALLTRCEISVGKDLLLGGVGSNNPYPVNRLAACDTEAARLKSAHAATSSWTKLFGAALSVAGQVAIAVLILSTALLALVSELLLAVAFAVLPVAAAAVAFPGGRKIAGMWLSTLLKGIVGLGVGMLFLSIVITVLTAVVHNTSSLAMLERQVLFVLLAVAAMRLRKMVPQAAQKLSATLSGKVANLGSGGGGGGWGAAAGGIAGGLAGGLAAGAVASQVMPAQAGAYAVRAARRLGAGTMNAAAGAAGSMGIATGRLDPEGGIAKTLSARAHGGSLIGAGAHAAASAVNAKLTGAGGAQEAALSTGLSNQRIEELAGGRKQDRRAAAKQATNPEMLRRLAEDRNEKVRATAAANPNMPTDVRDEMSRNRGGRVSREFRRRHATSTGTEPPPPPGGSPNEEVPTGQPPPPGDGPPPPPPPPGNDGTQPPPSDDSFSSHSHPEPPPGGPPDEEAPDGQPPPTSDAAAPPSGETPPAGRTAPASPGGPPDEGAPDGQPPPTTRSSAASPRGGAVSDPPPPEPPPPPSGETPSPARTAPPPPGGPPDEGAPDGQPPPTTRSSAASPRGDAAGSTVSSEPPPPGGETLSAGRPAPASPSGETPPAGRTAPASPGGPPDEGGPGGQPPPTARSSAASPRGDAAGGTVSSEPPPPGGGSPSVGRPAPPPRPPVGDGGDLPSGRDARRL